MSFFWHTRTHSSQWSRIEFTNLLQILLLFCLWIQYQSNDAELGHASQSFLIFFSWFLLLAYSLVLACTSTHLFSIRLELQPWPIVQCFEKMIVGNNCQCVWLHSSLKLIQVSLRCFFQILIFVSFLLSGKRNLQFAGMSSVTKVPLCSFGRKI